MSCRRSIRGCRRIFDEPAGFTLVELLVAMLLTGIVLAVAAGDFLTAARTRREMNDVIEIQQGVQAAIAAITMEVRQAGACLPSQGDFIWMGGEDEENRDVLIVRTGLVDPGNMSCIRAVMSEEAEEGDTVITVDEPDRFESGDRVYIRRSGGTGGYFNLVSVGDETLQITPSLDAIYPAGSGVFSIEEREYRVEDDDAGNSRLLVAIDGGEPQPLVDGVTELNVAYRLAPCPPCEEVDFPEDDAEWWQVREIRIDVKVQGQRVDENGERVVRSGSSTVRPRNLL